MCEWWSQMKVNHHINKNAIHKLIKECLLQRCLCLALCSAPFSSISSQARPNWAGPSTADSACRMFRYVAFRPSKSKRYDFRPVHSLRTDCDIIFVLQCVALSLRLYAMHIDDDDDDDVMCIAHKWKWCVHRVCCCSAKSLRKEKTI